LRKEPDHRTYRLQRFWKCYSHNDLIQPGPGWPHLLLPGVEAHGGMKRVGRIRPASTLVGLLLWGPITSTLPVRSAPYHTHRRPLHSTKLFSWGAFFAPWRLFGGPSRLSRESPARRKEEKVEELAYHSGRCSVLVAALPLARSTTPHRRQRCHLVHSRAQQNTHPIEKDAQSSIEENVGARSSLQRWDSLERRWYRRAELARTGLRLDD
jgi:hypothetical protein